MRATVRMEIDKHTLLFRAAVKEAIAWSGIVKGAWVLDVGVGRLGISSRVLSALGAKAVCLDTDGDKAGSIDRRAIFHKGDIRKTKWPDGEFDAVTSVLTLHELPEADHPRALKEMMRLARRVVIVEKTPATEDATGALQMAWRMAMDSLGRTEQPRPPLYWFRRVDELRPARVRCRFVKFSKREEMEHFRGKLEEIKLHWREQGVPGAIVESLDAIQVDGNVEMPPFFVIVADF